MVGATLALGRSRCRRCGGSEVRGSQGLPASMAPFRDFGIVFASRLDFGLWELRGGLPVIDDGAEIARRIRPSASTTSTAAGRSMRVTSAPCSPSGVRAAAESRVLASNSTGRPTPVGPKSCASTTGGLTQPSDQSIAIRERPITITDLLFDHAGVGHAARATPSPARRGVVRPPAPPEGTPDVHRASAAWPRPA